MPNPMDQLHSWILTPVAAAVIGLMPVTGSAQAVLHGADGEVIKSEAVVVTASRTEKNLTDVTSSLFVIDSASIKERQPQNLYDLLGDVPNVNVDENSIFSGKISIRGFNPGQNTYLIDGMQQKMTTNAGNCPMGTYIDPSMLKQVEVKRGGGSSLYGSGGMGGTIAVQTKSAKDLLEPGEKVGGLAKVGYYDETKTWSESAAIFARHEAVHGLAYVTRRDGGDKSNRNGTSVMVKGGWDISENSALNLTYNYDDNHLDDGTFDRITNYTQHRVVGQWDYSNGDYVDLQASVQYAQNKYKFLNGAVDFTNDYDQLGVNVQNTSLISLGGEHTLTYGADTSFENQKGYGLDWMTGTYGPTTERPDVDLQDIGLFLRDEYDINRYVTVTPILRWTKFRRESQTDLGTSRDSRFTPGVTLTVKPTDNVKLWGSVHEGFRPPSADEMFFYMDFSMYPDRPGYVMPNPDLKPEKSTNYELGASIKGKSLWAADDEYSARLVGFYTKAKDYISPTDISVNDQGLMIVTTENIEGVKVKGLELDLAYRWNDLRVNLGYGLVHKTDEDTQERIKDTPPQSANIRVGYRINPLNMETWYRMNWKAGNDTFKSYNHHDVGLTWTPTIFNNQTVTIGANIHNVFDKKVKYKTWEGDGRSYNLWINARF